MTSAGRSAAALAGAAVAAALQGCAGGGPLLHPARTLASGEVRVASGVSGHVAVGPLADDLRAAQNEAAADPQAPGAPGTNPTYARGALVAAAIAPGIAPVVAGRVGVGASSEGGLTYTGRSVRIDLRRSFELGGGATFSAGAGGTAVFYGRQQGSPLPNVDLSSLHGYGADAPLLIGWESDGGLYKVWGGARAGFEHDRIETLRSEPRDATAGDPLRLVANRFYGGGLVGGAAGFRHVHVALELQAVYESVSGDYNGNSVQISGLTLSPAAAAWWQF